MTPTPMTPTTPTLVVLAAGMGSRFGGPKQVAAVGPAGETILDYSLFDARRAGFGKAVLVIRREMRDLVERSVVARWGGRLPVELVEQRPDDLPPDVARPAARAKPWGTGQAVLAAARVVHTPFVAVNADDFYGHATFEVAAAFLFAPPRGGVPVYASIGFPLGDTLSDAGGVNRALLRVSPDGWLEAVEEVAGIERHDGGGRYRAADGAVRTLPADALVSMNAWALTPEVFPQLDAGFRAFLGARGADERAEYLLPDAMQSLVRAGRAQVKVLRGGGPWCGVTHAEDVPRVAAVLRDLVGRGVYPRRLPE